MIKKKELDIQLSMLLKEYEELEEHVSDLELDEKKLKYYLLLDKIYFLMVVVSNNRKYNKKVNLLLDRVESSYNREVLGNERVELVEKGFLEDFELVSYPTIDSDSLNKGVYECRVIYEDQLNILMKYIKAGVSVLNEEDIEQDIRDYLYSENVDVLEKVSNLDKLFIRELLNKNNNG